MQHLRLVFLLLLVLGTGIGYGQSCDPDSLQIEQIRVQDTDPNLSPVLVRHYTYFNPTCPSRNTLLVYLPGTFANPLGAQLFPSLAANHGFHAVSLVYPNDQSAASLCASSTDTNCFLNMRKETLEGVDYTSVVTVDSTNSIYNRLEKLLIYLNSQFPSQNWSQFMAGGTLQWSSMIIAGHSQGGGHAAVASLDHAFERVIMFASPDDFSTQFNSLAPWSNSTHTTLDSNYYAFGHLDDGASPFSRQFSHWNRLGAGTTGDSVYIDQVSSPYFLSRMLYTRYDAGTGLNNHNCVVLDNPTPKDSAGNPIFAPVWEYLLGLNLPTTARSAPLLLKETIRMGPNPCSNSLTVYLDDAKWLGSQVILSGSMGQTIKQVPLNPLKTILNLDELPSGVYPLRVEQNGQVVFYRLIRKE